MNNKNLDKLIINVLALEEKTAKEASAMGFVIVNFGLKVISLFSNSCHE
jgi:hypothetical protein